MQYDDLYNNEKYFDYLSDTISNKQSLIKKYNLGIHEINTINEYVNLQLQSTEIRIVELQLEIQKLNSESNFYDKNRFVFRNKRLIEIYFETIQNINIKEVYFIGNNYQSLYDMSNLVLAFLQKYSRAERKRIKKRFGDYSCSFPNLDKTNTLGNSFTIIKSFIDDFNSDCSLFSKIKNKIYVAKLFNDDEYISTILSIIEKNKFDYINIDKNRFIVLEYLILFPLKVLQLKEEGKIKALEDTIELCKKYNVNHDMEYILNDLYILQEIGSHQILSYSTSLLSRVFYFDYNDLRELYLFFYSDATFQEFSFEKYMVEDDSKNTNIIKKRKLFIHSSKKTNGELNIDIDFSLFNMFFEESI